MSTGTKAFTIWSTLCIAITAALLWIVPNIEWDHPGKNVTFFVPEGNQFATERDATIEAASSTFFLLRNEKTSEVVSGSPTQKPLGWISDEYYIAGPMDLDSGTWIAEIGSPTIHLYADTDIKTVETKSHDQRVMSGLRLSVVMLLFWIFGLTVGSRIKWD